MFSVVVFLNTQFLLCGLNTVTRCFRAYNLVFSTIYFQGGKKKRCSTVLSSAWGFSLSELHQW